jgi:hypothetical protein
MLGRAFVALIVTLLSVTPIYAEDERVLVDLVVRMQPNDYDGHCMRLEPGRLQATLQLVGRPVLPVRFLLGIAQDTDAERIRTTVEPDPITYSIPVDAGIYCYSLHDEWVGQERTAGSDETTYTQLVALRLVWSPDWVGHAASDRAGSSR